MTLSSRHAWEVDVEVTATAGLSSWLGLDARLLLAYGLARGIGVPLHLWLLAHGWRWRCVLLRCALLRFGGLGRQSLPAQPSREVHASRLMLVDGFHP